MPQFDPPLKTEEIDAAFPRQFRAIAPVVSGGQGSVFRVDEHDGSVIALKIYVPNAGANVEERTGREVAALEQLQCPTIVKLRGHGERLIRGVQCRFVSTTFIDGDTVERRVAVGPPLTVEGIAQVAADIADAIDAMWATGARIVHRDIKPANVMLSAARRAVLIDLGLARHTTLDSLTVSGQSWGTAGYLSPEQASARKGLTCKSDVFALGVLLQYCLLGGHPTHGNQHLLLKTRPNTASLRTRIPRDYAAVVDRMLSTSPVVRPLPSVISKFFRPLAKGDAW